MISILIVWWIYYESLKSHSWSWSHIVKIICGRMMIALDVDDRHCQITFWEISFLPCWWNVDRIGWFTHGQIIWSHHLNKTKNGLIAFDDHLIASFEQNNKMFWSHSMISMVKSFDRIIWTNKTIKCCDRIRWLTWSSHLIASFELTKQYNRLIAFDD